MLYMTTALYCEAKPFIRHYHLKKTDRFNKFQVFLGDKITLIITGVGEIAASVAISCVCSVFSPKEEDFFLSFGTSAAISRDLSLGEIYLINKITQSSTDQTYYPDVLFHHPFQEVKGLTGGKLLQEDSKIMKQSIRKKSKELLLYDMEGAASYISASYFFELHQMAFLRIISDYGIKEKGHEISLTPDMVSSMIESKSDVLFTFIEKCSQMKKENPFWNTEAEQFLVEMEATLHLSVSMRNILQQHMKYYLLMHDDLSDIVRWSQNNIVKNCKSKKEGKIYFEELKQQLL